LHRLLRGLSYRLPGRRFRRVDREREKNLPVRHHDVGEIAGGGEIGAVRPLDRAQALANFFFRNCHEHRPMRLDFAATISAAAGRSMREAWQTSADTG